MKFELQQNNKNATKENILEDINQVVKQHKIKRLTQTNYKKHGRYTIWMIYDRFGSWFNMLEEANLNKTRNLNISEKDLLENIMEVWIKLQRQPKYNDMRESFSKYKISTYDRRFGSWTNALEAFIQYANNIRLDVSEVTRIADSRHKTPRNINQRLRFVVMRRDNFKCAICGESPAKKPNVELHVDHIIPWAKGGETELENLQTLCAKCNLGKSDLDMDNLNA